MLESTAPLEKSEQQQLRIELEVFEGPMDLLLHLIRTQELDIYDIPISRVTEQYLKYLSALRDLNISVAGEFLVMAATLILIKSRLLLPPDPNAEEEGFEDPRAELVDRLLEYEKFKSAAHLLYEKETVELGAWPRGIDEFEDEERELVDVNVYDLVRAFHRIVERFKEQIVLEVPHETVSLRERIDEIRRLLGLKKEVLFSHFLEGKLSKLYLVVTFFALLELVRLHEIRLSQKGLFRDILIRAC